ncbi:hypothetical protein [Streptomyces bacillaris]|uniref:hypothetical protein n=1 Tax=Streptomyces bacillaris TaxID=68179 RepID=UPI003460736B
MRAALKRATEGPDAPVRELLDESALAAATADDPQPGYRTGTELVLALDFWLRGQNVGLGSTWSSEPHRGGDVRPRGRPPDERG